MNDLSPVWQPFKVDASRLCNCDRDRKIFFSVYDWDKDGTHDLIGQARATFADLDKLARNGNGLKLSHPKMGNGVPFYILHSKINIICLHRCSHTDWDTGSGGSAYVGRSRAGATLLASAD
eukprot:SAG31_NODE_2416_length_5732_cov_1.503462_5_plen_121_part_00